MAAAAVVLLCSVLIIMGCLYDYFGGVQERQLEDELALAQTGVECSGKTYLKALEGESYRLTWIAPSGEVLFDSQADESSMENHAQREEVRQALETGEGQSSRYSSTLLEKTIYYAKKLTDGSILRISISRATAGVLVMGMLQPMLVVLAAALILADKSDVRRSRVRNTDISTFDIHDRVNYSVTKSELKINEAHTLIKLKLTVDTHMGSVMDYFEIFMARMILCRKAAEKLGLQFKLMINEQQLI